jgi:predicted amidophosphoribosyltransferase
MTRATFTCDSCSAPVELHDSRCPSCGKVFDAVRCPRCGHQGPPGAFTDGCPRCRYLASPPQTGPRRAPRPRRSLFTPVMAVLLALLALAAGLAWALRLG